MPFDCAHPLSEFLATEPVAPADCEGSAPCWGADYSESCHCAYAEAMRAWYAELDARNAGVDEYQH